MSRKVLHMIIRQGSATALSFAALLGGLQLATPPAYGAYKPEKVTLKGEAKRQLRETVSLIKELPDTAKEALIASSLGLFFGKDGSPKYNSYFRKPTTGAMYVSSAGELRDWTQTSQLIPPIQWNQVIGNMRNLGAHAVLPAFTKEVTAVIYGTAKYIIASMPEELRDAVLAEEGSLLYTDNGQKAYTGKNTYLTVDGCSVSAFHRQLSPGITLRYRDSKGQEQNYNSIVRKYDKEWKRRREIFAYCISYTSRKEILALFSNELSALRDAKKAEPTPDTPNPGDSTQAASPGTQEKGAAPSTTTAMGNTVAPQSGTPSSDATTLDALKKMQPLAREAWLSEIIGLCFMEDNSPVQDGNNKTAKGMPVLRAGAAFVGSDGRVHDFRQAQTKQDEANWQTATDTLNVFKKVALLRLLAQDVEKMCLSAIKYHFAAMPELMRDAMLAETAGCLYTAEGVEAYTGKLNYATTINKFSSPYRATNNLKATVKFRDTKGVEHTLRDRNPYWNAVGSHWNILQTCISLVGPEKALSLFPNEVALLRKNNPEAAKFPAPSITPFLQRNVVVTPAASAATPPPASNLPSVTALSKMPSDTREAWLAECIGLCFMPDNSPILAPNKWTKQGALYIGSDGKEHKFWEERKKGEAFWGPASRNATEGNKPLIVRSFSAQVRQMVQQMLRYHYARLSEFMREAWLAEIGGCIYMPDGTSGSIYTRLTYEIISPTGYKTATRSYLHPKAKFRDSKGAEHNLTERTTYWRKGNTSDTVSWDIMHTCAGLLGTKEVEALFANELTLLRKNNPEAAKHPAPVLPSLLEAPAPNETPASADSSTSSDSDDGNSAMGRRWL